MADVISITLEGNKRQLAAKPVHVVQSPILPRIISKIILIDVLLGIFFKT